MHPLNTKNDDPITTALRVEYQAANDQARDLWAAFDSARKESGIVEGKADRATVKRLSDMQAAYEKAADSAEELHDRLLPRLGKATRNGNQGGSGVSIGKAFLDGVGQKALEGTSGGSMVPPFMDSGILDLPQRALFVRSLIPVRRAEGDKVWFLRQSVATNLAAPVAAGADKPKSTFTVERIEQPVTTIAHISEAMDRALLSDYDELVSFLDRQLTLGVLLAEEAQIINGTGTAPELRGILNTVGILTHIMGSDPEADALHKAVTKVRLGFFEPDGIVMHPNDWEQIRLSKATTGEYLAGEMIQSDPDRIWGKRVVTTSVLAENTAIVGDFGNGAVLWDREEARVTFTESGLADAAGKDLFSRNQIRFRGEERVAFGVTRPAAFCKVTLAAA